MVEKIGLDFSGLKNISVPEFDIPNSTSAFFNQMPVRANEVTGGWLGYGIISTMFVTVFWTLSDTSPFGTFSYSPLRALGLTLSICSIFSMVLLNLGFINSLLVVGTSITMLMVVLIIIQLTETRE